MTAADLLSRLDGVRQTAKGWSARCPAHGPDRNPSLSIRGGERGVLLHCFSGCTTAEVCHALGVEVRDLFYDDPRGSPSRHPSRPEPKPPTIRELECQVWGRAMALDLRALGVLDAARGLDVSDWTEADYDTAMRAVCRAREDLRLAEMLHGLAFAMRETIQKEDAHAQRRRSVA